MKSLKSILNEVEPKPVTSGQIIRAIRKSLELTLKDVESISGIRETHLSAIENDAYELTKKYAEKIAATLGVQPWLILFPEGNSPSPEIREIQKRRKKLLASK
jgi:transcriptional regulator with XRE-family HTH domain